MSMTNGTGVLSWLLRVLWLLAAGIIAVLSVVPPGSRPIQLLASLTTADKLLHFAAYASLGFLPALHERRKVLLGMLAFVMLLGLGLEFAQDLVPGRSFEWLDLLANWCGALSGAFSGAWLGAALARRHTSGGSQPSSR